MGKLSRPIAEALRSTVRLVREGAEHEVWRCGDVQIAIPVTGN